MAISEASAPDFLERCGYVAAFAPVAERFPVHIVTFMAVDALGTRRGDTVAGTRMTSSTSDLAMGPIENEACPLVMVEVPYTPVACVVTARTRGTQPPLMRILPGMAGRAFLARVLESGAHMAGIAFDREMATRERKCGSSVIKTGLVPR